VIWRLPLAIRVLITLSGAVFVLLGLFGITQAPEQAFAWLGALFLAVLGVFTAAFARRTCTIDDRFLQAKGRFATRQVELRDLRQVAMGAGGHVWIQSHHPLDRRGGNVLSLRMIPQSAAASLLGWPAGERAVELIRSRAAAAGAELDPPLPDRKIAPSRKPLIFSI
jgi:hypothetical protein